MNVVPIHPKTEAMSIGHHRLTMRYVPGAPADKQWEWSLGLQRVFYYTGRAASIEDCKAAATEIAMERA